MPIDVANLEQLLTGPGRTDPVERLLEVSKTFVAKRPTRTPANLITVDLRDAHVDPDYQRPPDREKIREFVQHLKAGGKLPPIKVNERPDGSHWITDGQHRAAAALIAGGTHAKAYRTRVAQQDEPQETEIVAKVTASEDESVRDRLLGSGAEPHGKRLVLTLGKTSVTYLPHDELVGELERGQLIVLAPDARDAIRQLDLPVRRVT